MYFTVLALTRARAKNLRSMELVQRVAHFGVAVNNLASANIVEADSDFATFHDLKPAARTRMLGSSDPFWYVLISPDYRVDRAKNGELTICLDPWIMGFRQ